MQLEQLSAEAHEALEGVLGYLNFSSGARDRKVLGRWNQLYRALATISTDDGGSTGDEADSDPALWQQLAELMLAKLNELQQTSDTFRDGTQAREVIEQTCGHVIPAYLSFHRDLMFLDCWATRIGPFLLGRFFEVVLQRRNEEGPVTPEDAIAREALAASVVAQMNDYLGYRPVAALETEQKIEPYPHERCHPNPLYIQGVGTAFGPYEALIARTIDILKATDPDLLDEACFDPERLQEMAVDPRPYDFDHPVNKRPNYQFGLWDPHHLDSQGYFDRFVVQQATLDSLIARLRTPSDLDADELLFEAAAALAGTILMASGVSGNRPDTHSSEVTLSTLLPKIASYRDRFYEQLLATVPDNERLRGEAAQWRQPFAGVRQALNTELARQRAGQLEHVHLAKLYARMGYPSASARQASFVPTASARMVCMIQSLLTEAHRRLDLGESQMAAVHLPRIVDLLHRGVACGAIVDPWNILGFDGNFSLFPAIENTVHDHRVDELVELMDQILSLYSRAWCQAAAGDHQATCRDMAQEMNGLADWWDQFAAPAVHGIDAEPAAQLFDATTMAADALAAWRKKGKAMGDVGLWQPHVEAFDSPKAYVLVLDALLDQHDYLASMSLMIHWLAQADRIGLQSGNDVFHVVATRWLHELLEPNRSETSAGVPGGETLIEDDRASRWTLAEKFFDYLEANAGELWETPELTIGGMAEYLDEELDEDDLLEDEEEDEDAGLYAAAYDEMVYRDSTDDGVDGQLIGDEYFASDYELELEARRISEHLTFFVTLAQLWKNMALAAGDLRRNGVPIGATSMRMSQWLQSALEKRSQLLELMRGVVAHKIPAPSATLSAQMEFDRQRAIQESLLERIMAAVVACTEASYFLLASCEQSPEGTVSEEMTLVANLLRALANEDSECVRAELRSLMDFLAPQTLLYVPLVKGGDPNRITIVRSRQRALRLLLALLPRRGLLVETRVLLDLCAEMEHQRAVGPGAVTDFDQLFKVGHQAMLECLVASHESWSRKCEGDADGAAVEPSADIGRGDDSEQQLLETLQQLTEVMLRRWLEHSRTLRLSVLEKVNGDRAWQKLVDFIGEFGHVLFDQSFFNLANLRSILHGGVENWLDEIRELDDERYFPLLAAAEDEKGRRRIVEQLQLVVEAVVENYVEYRDYNSTTTHSDRGELLHLLLDILRLRVAYDRVAWNLLPVNLTHEVLVRMRHAEAAESLRGEVVQKTAEIADQMVSRLVQLQQQTGMRLSTVSNRLGERFVRPLLVDRGRALVRPAMGEARYGKTSATFDELEQQIDELTQEPTGVGLDVPTWLETMEEEVEVVASPYWHRSWQVDIAQFFPQRLLSQEELQSEADDVE